MAALDNVFYINTASINSLAGTGSLLGTLIGSASWASQSLWATSASFASQSISASWAPVPVSASWASQSIWAISASFASQSISSSYSVSSSYALVASTLLGSISAATSASWASQSFWAASSSFASSSITASYFKVTPGIKSGKITASAFVGSPLTCSYTFSSSYANTAYSVAIIGGDNRAWTLEQVSASSFTISTNSTVALTDYVYWMSMATGESS